MKNLEPMEHRYRLATIEEAKWDCCGDRYACNVVYVCSCDLHGCTSCMSRHILGFHWDENAEAKRKQAELEESARKKFATLTKEEKQVLGLEPKVEMDKCGICGQPYNRANGGFCVPCVVD